MIIGRVELRNFRSHRRSVIDLGEGTNVLLGENGSGKTSILDAIAYALFRVQPQGVNVEQMTRMGSREMSVSLDFSIRGGKYRIIRSRKGGKPKKTALYELGQRQSLVAMGDEETKKKVEELLGITGNVFTTAMYARQGEIDALLTTIPSRRKEIMGRLIGTKEMEEAYSSLGEVLKHFNFKLESYKGLNEKLREKKEKKEKNEKEMMALREKKKGIVINLESTKNRRKELEKVIKDMREIIEYESEIKNLEIQKKHIKKELKRIDDYSKVEMEESQKAREYEKLYQEKASIAQENAKLEEKRAQKKKLEKRRESLLKKKKEKEEFINSFIEDCNKKVQIKYNDAYKIKKEIERIIQNYKKNKKTIENEIKDLYSRINYHKEKINELSKSLKNLDSIEGRCPTCNRELEEHTRDEIKLELKNEIKNNDFEIKKLDKKYKQKNDRLENLEDEMKELESINFDLAIATLRELKAILEELEDIEKEVEGYIEELKNYSLMKKSYEEIEYKLNSLKDNYDRYVEARNYLRKYLPEKEDLEEKLSFIDRDVKIKKGKIENLKQVLFFKSSKENLKEKEDKLRNINQKIEKKTGELSSTEARITSARDYLRELEKEEKELLAREKEREQLEKYINFLERVRETFHKDFLQRKLRERARPLIEKYTREVFESFNLPYTDLIIKDDYSVSLVGPGGERNIETLSGGEIIASSLALRIGVAKALSGPAMDMIMLDEPTIHLDSPRRRELVEIIKKLSSLDQTIVVTHDREFEEAATSVHLVEKEGGISRVRGEAIEPHASPYQLSQ